MSSKTNIVLRFVLWYLVHEPTKIAKGYLAYAKALFEIVPFGFLLLTLFSPWKNILDRRTEHGINIGRMLERMSLSLLARGTGCIVRITTILLGLFFQILLLAGTAAYLVLWYGAPGWIVILVFKIIELIA